MNNLISSKEIGSNISPRNRNKVYVVVELQRNIHMSLQNLSIIGVFTNRQDAINSVSLYQNFRIYESEINPANIVQHAGDVIPGYIN